MRVLVRVLGACVSKWMMVFSDGAGGGDVHFGHGSVDFDGCRRWRFHYLWVEECRVYWSRLAGSYLNKREDLTRINSSP